MVFKKIYEIWKKGQRYDEVVEQLRGEKRVLENDISELENELKSVRSEKREIKAKKVRTEKELVDLKSAVQKMMDDRELNRLEDYKV